MPKRIKSRKKSKRKRQRQKKKNKGHLLSVVHGSWLKIPVACRLLLAAWTMKHGPWTWHVCEIIIFTGDWIIPPWFSGWFVNYIR